MFSSPRADSLNFRAAQAAVHGDISELRAAVEHCPILLDPSDPAELLHAAAGAGQVEIVRLLLENGIGVNNVDQYGATPLFYALRRDRHAVARLLRDSGASLVVPSGVKRVAWFQICLGAAGLLIFASLILMRNLYPIWLLLSFGVGVGGVMQGVLALRGNSTMATE